MSESYSTMAITMLRRASIAVFAIFTLGCRSRVEISGASLEAPAPTQDPCGASLLPGAAAPILGYCPSRANRSQNLAPAVAPSLRFSVPLGEIYPSQAAVDNEGRIYMTIDEDPEDEFTAPQTLIALLADGAESFRYQIKGNAGLGGVPVLTEDGGVLVMEGTWDGEAYDKVLLKFTSDGTIEDEMLLPDDVSPNPAVDSEGALYFATFKPDTPARVVALSKEGDMLWSAEGLGDASGSMRAPAVGLGRQIIVGTDKGGATSAVIALSPDSGEILWEQPFDGYLVGGPAVGSDGMVYVSISRKDFNEQDLWILSPEGQPLHRVDLGGLATPAPAPLAVAADGTAFVRLLEEVVAVDRTGKERFRRSAHPNLIYGATLDKAGMLLLTSGRLSLLDPMTGEAIWELAPPNALSCLGPATSAGPGLLLFGQCDGTFHMVGEP
jgi:outer membrane protein assembly factor BamB